MIEWREIGTGRVFC